MFLVRFAAVPLLMITLVKLFTHVPVSAFTEHRTAAVLIKRQRRCATGKYVKLAAHRRANTILQAVHAAAQGVYRPDHRSRESADFMHLKN